MQRCYMTEFTSCDLCPSCKKVSLSAVSDDTFQCLLSFLKMPTLKNTAGKGMVASSTLSTRCTLLQGLPLLAAAGAQKLQSDSAPADAGSKGRWSKLLMGGGVAAAAGGLGFVLAEEESEHGLHAPEYPWSHNGWFSAYDHASIRRGHQVYQQVGKIRNPTLSWVLRRTVLPIRSSSQSSALQVCAACHSVEQIHYRNLVGVAYTEEEVKEMAAEVWNRTLGAKCFIIHPLVPCEQFSIDRQCYICCTELNFVSADRGGGRPQ